MPGGIVSVSSTSPETGETRRSSLTSPSHVACRTYSTFSRGIELGNAAFQYLDLLLKGRDEGDRPMAYAAPRSLNRAADSARVPLPREHRGPSPAARARAGTRSSVSG